MNGFMGIKPAQGSCSFCPECGAKIESDTAKYCPECATQLIGN
jgi:predicted amidophosphoribosyltransferase